MSKSWALTLIISLLLCVTAAVGAEREAAAVPEAAAEVVPRVVEWLVLDPADELTTANRVDSSVTPNFQIAAIVPADPAPLFAPDAAWFTLSNGRPVKQQSAGSRFSGAEVVAVTCYGGRAMTLAGDLSDRVKAVDQPLAEGPLAPLVVAPFRVARANEIASGWVDELLRPAAGDVIGVVLLLQRPTDATDVNLLTQMSTSSAVPAEASAMLSLADRDPVGVIVVLFKLHQTPDRQWQVNRLVTCDISNFGK